MKVASPQRCLLALALALSFTAPNAARADDGMDDSAYDKPSTPFMLRHRPLPMALELGIHGGLNWLSSDHNLIESGRTHQAFGTAPELGLRLGFYPLSFAGIEAEGAFIPSSTKDDDRSARLAALRGHLVLQLPMARIVPFVLGGGGFVALTGGSMGKDTDPALHFGGGVKFAVTEHFTVRVDVRDTLLQKDRLIAGVSNGDVVHNPSVLVGAAFTLGRTKAAPARAGDRDGDGVADDQDKCPDDAGSAADGCPAAAPVSGDADGDGVADSADKCPTAAEDGAPSEPADGCPSPDRDGDGILTADDACPEVAGVAPDGCPAKDTDGDSINDNVDKCPAEAETVNGFQDDDGCPDTLPKEVSKFTGAIKGINFASGKAAIRKSSFVVLDDVAKLLNQYPDLRIRITGHTDSRGAVEANRKLSQDRAQALKEYLVGKGIADGRIETHGAGPDAPVADNKTEAGRAKNRRIEFELLH